VYRGNDQPALDVESQISVMTHVMRFVVEVWTQLACGRKKAYRCFPAVPKELDSTCLVISR